MKDKAVRISTEYLNKLSEMGQVIKVKQKSDVLEVAIDTLYRWLEMHKR